MNWEARRVLLEPIQPAESFSSPDGKPLPPRPDGQPCPPDARVPEDDPDFNWSGIVGEDVIAEDSQDAPVSEHIPEAPAPNDDHDLDDLITKDIIRELNVLV